MHSPVVEYNDLSDYDKTYVLNFQPKGTDEWKWLLPTSNARYANHSCDPNSYISPTQELITRRPIKANEQITFVYNNGDESEWWDPVWNFDCACGAENCQGAIDRYRKFEIRS
ncbi:hypothetical protein HDV00_001957 [Rhizophlyctis rosea]|nr:hypothetical protein HDV00_001957 [Rhizophlyctis rosea]